MTDIIPLVQNVLSENPYIDAKGIAKKCKLSLSRVYRAIRLLREGKEGFWNRTGVHSTKNGYILSEFAKRTDDLNFLRRLNGRRTSDVIALGASETYIRHRWHSVTDRRTLQLALSDLSGSSDALIKGRKVITEKIIKLGGTV